MEELFRATTAKPTSLSIKMLLDSLLLSLRSGVRYLEKTVLMMFYSTFTPKLFAYPVYKFNLLRVYRPKHKSLLF